MIGAASWILLFPVLGAVTLLFVPKAQIKILKMIAMIASAGSLLAAAHVFYHYDRIAAGYQFIDKLPWLPSLGISYHVGVDGINAILLLMTSILGVAGVYVSFTIKERLKEYLVFYLFLLAGCLGTLAALDVFLMYFFYECAVLPVFPLIGVWGSGNKAYATMKLTLYLTLGALCALIAILGLYFATGLGTFDFPAIEAALRANPLPIGFQKWAFPLLMVGFGVILTLWPFHTWSPMGYAAAPTSVSMLHAGVLKKLGAYMIIRLGLSLMPAGAAHWMPVVAWIAVINILYCGLVAFTQKDLKYILGYASCSHMGYILLGLSALTPIALNGVVYFMFAHGIMAALGFALVGFVYDKTHSRMLDDWGGYGKKIPFISTLFIMTGMASAGLPGFGNFVSEMMILAGSWQTQRIPAIAGVLGLVVTAGYTLRMVRGTMQGPFNAKHAKELRDARGLEKLPYAVLLLILLAVGVMPSILLPTITSGTKPIAQTMIAPGQTEVSHV